MCLAYIPENGELKTEMVALTVVFKIWRAVTATTSGHRYYDVAVQSFEDGGIAYNYR